MVNPEQSNPFVGPRPLVREDGIFGRAEEIRELAWFFAAERIVWLHSPSGAGKTSLIQAGLVPRLETIGFQVLPKLRVNGPPVSDRNRYEAAVLDCLKGTGSLLDYLAATPSRRGRVLIFDQFEEVLTLDPTDIEEKQAFFRTLGKVLEIRDIWALFVVREDHLPALDSYARMLPTGMNHRFRLELLDRQNAHEAIVATVAKGGREITAEASLQLAKSLAKTQDLTGKQWRDGDIVEPVLLQVVCHGMWETFIKKKYPAGQKIGVGDIPDEKGFQQAVSAYYAASLKTASSGSGATERLLREWIEANLIVGGVRHQVPRDEPAKTAAGLPADLVKGLENTHLIRPDPRGNRTWYELSHDRLIQPILENNRSWADEKLNFVQLRAKLWKRQDKPKSILLSDTELSDADRLSLEEGSAWSANDLAFLAESKVESAVRRKMRLGMYAIGAFAFVAVLAAAAAVVAWKYADASDNLARAQLANRTGNSGAAVAFALRALEASAYLDANQKRDAVEALSEGLQGGPALNEVNNLPLSNDGKSDPLPIHLALNSTASKLAVYSEKSVRIFDVSATSPGNPGGKSPWEDPPPDCPVTAAAFHPSEDRLWVGLTTGGFGPAEGTTCPKEDNEGRIQALAVLKDKGAAVIAGSVLRIAGAKKEALGKVESLALDPTGAKLAVGFVDGTVGILDVNPSTEKAIAVPIPAARLPKRITALSWQSDVIAAASQFSDEFSLSNTQRSTSRKVPNAVKGGTKVRKIAVSPDGKRVASIGTPDDEEVRVWDTESAVLLLTLRVPPAQVAPLNDLLFLDNERLLVAYQNGKVRRFPITQKALVAAAQDFLKSPAQ